MFPQRFSGLVNETTLINTFHRGREGFIAIGFQTDDVLLSRLPGWEPRSYGYHGDDGCSFSGSGQGNSYGPKFTSGDVIGALLNRNDRTIRSALVNFAGFYQRVFSFIDDASC
jgi:hypothetical protein